ncbi:tartrate-resistant acid phosphatase type 5-like isoform X2 [Sycon ciliatum]|uniref:tartrate-resistant acid phosphatase type 5-like isoform X2 n=1 Tax=Sycon ciliatum TaxID=27933 RepID=UPI0031F604FC
MFKRDRSVQPWRKPSSSPAPFDFLEVRSVVEARIRHYCSQCRPRSQLLVLVVVLALVCAFLSSVSPLFQHTHRLHRRVSSQSTWSGFIFPGFDWLVRCWSFAGVFAVELKITGLPLPSQPGCGSKNDITGNTLIIGDWGGQGTPPYKTSISASVGSAAGRTAKQLGVDKVLSPGDLFYPYGVTSVDDKRFQGTFEEQFSHPSLQVPWYVILGNHDHRGEVQALLDYHARSSRWNFPSRYYTKQFSIQVTNTSTLSYQILFLDTQTLLFGFFREAATDEKQWSWISSRLSKSTADWIIVVGHHPIYSVGSHGSSSLLVRRLLPLLERHGVAMYFSGHDHNLQHIHSVTQKVDMFVVGSATFSSSSTERKVTQQRGQCTRIGWPIRVASHPAVEFHHLVQKKVRA